MFVFFLMLSSLIFISPSLSYPTNSSNNHLCFSSLLKLEAEKLIRGLNLFPKHSINTPLTDSHFVPEKIVEKKFSFPNFDASSGPSVQQLGHHAGYYRLPQSKAARMFYFFFESRNSKDDPVVIWLSGGPGCSSELALFYENGPFQFTKNLSLVWNDYGWDKASNILFVDQPTGTGFSYTTDDNDIRHDEEGVSNDLYDFLQEHPQFIKNDFFIAGESYARHFIPAVVSRIHQGNKEKQGIHIILKGFAIGNGLTNPEIQYKAYTDYALDKGIIKKDDYNSINKLLPACEQAIETCGTEGGDTCVSSMHVCNDIFHQIMSIAGNINHYDIRKKCKGSLCYDFSNVEEFLNKKTVRDALGVGDLDFVSCSSTVYDAMVQDWMRNLDVGIPSLLEDGIEVLVYAGEEDLMCNWLVTNLALLLYFFHWVGNSRWVHTMEWSG
ncbi:putative carboxypeptidase C [Lupinus albus]|uniref:Putative carboxypeptidase C n=1 Tax=Lupinus albus TaxID=3870 RepID=A0A6A4PGE8_LUPAL|nr:putative carboxypeptidase C [Lupinus albus]